MGLSLLATKSFSSFPDTRIIYSRDRIYFPSVCIFPLISSLFIKDFKKKTSLSYQSGLVKFLMNNDIFLQKHESPKNVNSPVKKSRKLSKRARIMTSRVVAPLMYFRECCHDSIAACLSKSRE